LFVVVVVVVAAVVGAAVVAFVLVRVDGAVVVAAAEAAAVVVAVVVDAASVALADDGTRPAVRTAVPAMAPATPTAVKVRTRRLACSLAELELREKPAAEGFLLLSM
jgi:hypothetical protein